MRYLRCLVLACIAVVTSASTVLSAENAVLFWNNEMISAIRLARTPPPIAALHMASLHVSIFDAVNGITRTHQGWLVNEPAPAGIDMDAAIAGAAHTALKALWGQAANPHNMDVALRQALAAIPEGKAKDEGFAWGKKIAQAVLAKRATCGLDKPLPGPFASNEPGKWRETPPGFRPAVLPHVAKVMPFVMTSPDQFRAPPPPPLDSQKMAEEIAYVAKVGARDGAERTEYETLSGPFWSDDLGSCTPPGHWNIIASEIARRKNLSTVECARLFALLNLAEADAGVACWDSKFFYNLWRPETAIREVTATINPHAKALAEFIPNMGSPAFPTYTSGHSTFSSAGSRMLELYFGTDEIEFSATSDGLPGAVRTFTRLSDCRNEIGMSRVWAGIHFMVDNVEGQNCGMKIADYVMANALKPAATLTTMATK